MKRQKTNHIIYGFVILLNTNFIYNCSFLGPNFNNARLQLVNAWARFLNALNKIKNITIKNLFHTVIHIDVAWLYLLWRTVVLVNECTGVPLENLIYKTLVIINNIRSTINLVFSKITNSISWILNLSSILFIHLKTYITPKLSTVLKFLKNIVYIGYKNILEPISNNVINGSNNMYLNWHIYYNCYTKLKSKICRGIRRKINEIYFLQQNLKIRFNNGLNFTSRVIQQTKNKGNTILNYCITRIKKIIICTVIAGFTIYLFYKYYKSYPNSIFNMLNRSIDKTHKIYTVNLVRSSLAIIKLNNLLTKQNLLLNTVILTIIGIGGLYYFRPTPKTVNSPIFIKIKENNNKLTSLDEAKNISYDYYYSLATNPYVCSILILGLLLILLL
jgi:predicted DNA-binding ribbon-helix-helix protein